MLNSLINFNKRKAQSLVEVLLAVTVGVILIGSSVMLIGISIKTYRSIKQHLQANFLFRQEAEAIEVLAKSNWYSIYELERETDYSISFTENIWECTEGKEQGEINKILYKRYFKVENVYRNLNGKISPSGEIDASTLKITIFIDYGNSYEHSLSSDFYLIRAFKNGVFHQTDWSGGDGQEGPVTIPENFFASASNIDFSNQGYITMATTTEESELISSIFDTGIEGGASFNSLLWQGTLNAGCSVKFQIAFSNSVSGPWNYYGPTSLSDWYQPNPNVSLQLPIAGDASPMNHRFIRYKVKLSTSKTPPQIDDISINWNQ